MKEISGYLGIPVFLLVSTWGLLKTVVDVIERLNKIRDFSLGIPKESRDVSVALRHSIFYSDWIPLWFGLFIALAIFSAVYFMIPAIFREMHRKTKGEQADWASALMQPAYWGLSHIQVACYGMGLLAGFVAIAHLVCGLFDWMLVASHHT